MDKILLCALITFVTFIYCSATGRSISDFTECPSEVEHVTSKVMNGELMNFTCNRNGVTGYLTGRFFACHMIITHSDGICTVNNCNFPIIRSAMHYDMNTEMNATCNMPNKRIRKTEVGDVCSWLRPDCTEPQVCSVPTVSQQPHLKMNGHGLVWYECDDYNGEKNTYECNHNMPDIWIKMSSHYGHTIRRAVDRPPIVCYNRECSDPPIISHTTIRVIPPNAVYYCIEGYFSVPSNYNMSLECRNGDWFKVEKIPFKCEAESRNIVHLNSDVVLFVSVCGSIILLIITLLLAGYAKRCQQRRIALETAHISSHSSRAQERCTRLRSSRSGSSRRRRRHSRSLLSSFPPEYTILPEHQLTDHLGRMTPLAPPPPLSINSCEPPRYTSAPQADGNNPPSYIVTVSQSVDQVNTPTSTEAIANCQDIYTDYTLQLIQ